MKPSSNKTSETSHLRKNVFWVMVGLVTVITAGIIGVIVLGCVVIAYEFFKARNVEGGDTRHVPENIEDKKRSAAE